MIDTLDTIRAVYHIFLERGTIHDNLNPITTQDRNNIELSTMLERCEKLEVIVPMSVLCCQEFYDFERVAKWFCQTLSANESFRSLRLIFDWRIHRLARGAEKRRRIAIGKLSAIRGLRKVGDIPLCRTC